MQSTNDWIITAIKYLIKQCIIKCCPIDLNVPMGTDSYVIVKTFRRNQGCHGPQLKKIRCLWNLVKRYIDNKNSDLEPINPETACYCLG